LSASRRLSGLSSCVDHSYSGIVAWIAQVSGGPPGALEKHER
jgi:hypothetical protein